MLMGSAFHYIFELGIYSVVLRMSAVSAHPIKIESPDIRVVVYSPVIPIGMLENCF